MKTAAIGLMCLFGAATSAGGQTRVLTLDDVVRLALDHPQARAAALRARAARFDASAARTAFWPELDAAATTNGGFPGSSAGLGITGMNNSPFRRHFGAALEAKTTVWDFGRTLGRVHAADHAADRADAAGDVIRDDLTLEAVRRYYAVLASQSRVVASQERVASATALRDQIRVLANAGLRSGAELALAELDLASTRSAAVEADAALGRDRARLTIFIGLDGMTPIELTPTTVPLVEAPALESLFPGMERRPELRAARAAIEEARANEAAAQAEFRPRLVAVGSLGFANPPAASGRLDGATAPAGTGTGVWAAAGGVTVPLFGGLRDRSAVQAATARVEADTRAREDTERVMRLEVVDAYRAVREQVGLAQAYGDEARLAEQAAAATRASFQAGLLPYVEVAHTIEAVAEAHGRLAAAMDDYAVARAALARAAGLPIIARQP